MQEFFSEVFELPGGINIHRKELQLIMNNLKFFDINRYFLFFLYRQEETDRRVKNVRYV